MGPFPESYMDDFINLVQTFENSVRATGSEQPYMKFLKLCSECQKALTTNYLNV